MYRALCGLVFLGMSCIVLFMAVMYRAVYGAVYGLQAAQMEQMQNSTGLEDTSMTCQGNWPLFSSAAQLSNNKWGKYFKAVYGEMPQSGYPICVGDFWLLYADHLAAAGVALPQCQNGCPSSKGSGYWYPDNASLCNDTWMAIIRVYHFYPWTGPLSADTWVEVHHRSRSWSSGFERNGAWFYYSKGSGIWLNIGRTIHFDWHAQGFEYFNSSFENDMAINAAAQGFDTIQFLKGDGFTNDCCTQLNLEGRCDSLEFVATRLHGTYGCAEPPGGNLLRAGWTASRPCNCIEEDSTYTDSKGTYSFVSCEGTPWIISKHSSPKPAEAPCLPPLNGTGTQPVTWRAQNTKALISIAQPVTRSEQNTNAAMSICIIAVGIVIAAGQWCNDI